MHRGPRSLIGAAPTRERAHSIVLDAAPTREEPTLIEEWIGEDQVVDVKLTRLEATPEPEEVSLSISKCLNYRTVISIFSF